MPAYKLGEHTPVLPDPQRYWIAPNATVLGDVTLGEYVSIWFGAVVRGDHVAISIGRRSNVQDNAVLHADPGCPLTIGQETTIGHAAILHGCTIGDGVVVGMGAVVMNRAVIGDGCLVAAGAIITERNVFPANSLIVGAPAKAIRTLDEESAVRLRQGAAEYVANWQRAARELQLIPGT
jgi:carbonic anhydrase/acetyltransferase-like protein (isoleucine patch superfamily)